MREKDGKTPRDEISLQVEQVYFKAMLDGYFGTGEYKNSLVIKEGSETIITYSDPDSEFIVEHRFCENSKSEHSMGTIVIFQKGQPVWHMVYSGYCPKEVIPFLKKVLCETFSQKLFIGRRGSLWRHQGEPFWYMNHDSGDFDSFHGREEIRDSTTAKPLGWYEYSGNIMY